MHFEEMIALKQNNKLNQTIIRPSSIELTNFGSVFHIKIMKMNEFYSKTVYVV